MSDHATLTGLNLHSPWHYVQETDPGAVGAGLVWFKKSTKTLNYRNDANTGWISILASGSTANALPPGTTWTQFLNAYNSTDPGDTITLPNDVIYQEDRFDATGKAFRLRGSGPNSEVKLVSSSTHTQFQVGWDNVGNRTEFENFKMSQDRVALNLTAQFGFRGITAYSGTRGLYINRVTFQDISSTILAVMAEGWIETDPLYQEIDGIYMTNCVFDEWYESVVDFHEASNVVKNIVIDSCVGSTTERHPYGPVSAPYGINFEVEDALAQGQMRDIIVSNSSFTCSDSIISTLGLNIKTSGGANCLYTRIYCLNSVYSGWSNPFQLVSINGGIYSANAFIYVYKNSFSGEDSITARIDPAGQVGDFVFFGDNDLYPGSGHTAISTPGSWQPPLISIVQDPPNRIH